MDVELRRDRLQILVVEDEAVVALDIQAKLEELGYSVVALVRSGEEAVKAALEMHPDLILMDIFLQGDVDGISAAARIKIASPTPVAYMTGRSDRGTFYRAKLTRPQGYITKPFDAQELQATIEAALNNHEMSLIRQHAEREYASARKSVIELAQNHEGFC